MQQQIDELKRQMQEMAAASAVPAVPSSGASAGSSSSPVRAATLFAQPQQSSSLPPTQLSIGHRLHKDALHCVLAFLQLTELPSVMCSCRAWYAAMHTLPLQDASFSVNSPRQLYQLLISASTPIARHVVTCYVYGEYTADNLAQFLDCLPRLRSLSHRTCCSTTLHPHVYPNRLRELNVGLMRGSDEDALTAQMEHLRSAIGLRRLTLTIPSTLRDVKFISLASLECMEELESLTLYNGAAIPPELFIHIRRLSSLRTLSIDCVDDANGQLAMLVEERADCPQLQLHTFITQSQVDLARAELLASIPTLQRVEPFSLTPDALRLLAHGLPDLHTLKVSVHWTTPASKWTIVRDSLAACRQLTALTLQWAPLEELAALLFALPLSVRKLDLLQCVGVLQSDVFFQCVAEGGLRQLKQLHIRHTSEASDVAAWRARMSDCAPWINAMVDA
jgi:hypothetical protein